MLHIYQFDFSISSLLLFYPLDLRDVDWEIFKKKRRLWNLGETADRDCVDLAGILMRVTPFNLFNFM
jgi:hypothetical protein